MQATQRSVYLDMPTAKDIADLRGPEPRRPLTVALTIIGLIGLTLAGLGAIARMTLTDPQEAVEALDGSFADPAAKAELEAELAQLLRDDYLGPETMATAAGWGVDAEAGIDKVAAASVDDPAFRRAAQDLVARGHHRIMVKSSAVHLDVTEISTIITDIARQQAPELTVFLPDTPVTVIEGSSLPNLAPWLNWLSFLIVAGLAASTAIVVALITSTDRYNLGTWVGRWLIAVGILTAIAAVGLPYLASSTTGWTTIEAMVRHMSRPLLIPAAGIALFGLAFEAACQTAGKRRRNSVPDEGAAAALGTNEAPVARPGTGPSLAFPGLQGDRPLTSR